MFKAIVLTMVLTIVVLVSFSAQAAVFEVCSQGVSFSNRNTYKHISGVVTCIYATTLG